MAAAAASEVAAAEQTPPATAVATLIAACEECRQARYTDLKQSMMRTASRREPREMP